MDERKNFRTDVLTSKFAFCSQNPRGRGELRGGSMNKGKKRIITWLIDNVYVITCVCYVPVKGIGHADLDRIGKNSERFNSSSHKTSANSVKKRL